MNLSDLEGLGDIRDDAYFSHRFFEGLGDVDIESYDNFVLDVSVVYSVGVGRRYSSDVFADSDAGKEALSLLGKDIFKKNTRGGQDVLEFNSVPSSRVEAIEELSEDADIYLPDITRDCLEGSNRKMPYREEVLEAFEENSLPLEVKDVMGIDTYSRQGIESADTREEDRAILEAVEGLEGDTCVLTYDEDFLSMDTYAAVPEIASGLK